jgi:outer membrane receptor for ferrienterochelin and colicin
MKRTSFCRAYAAVALLGASWATPVALADDDATKMDSLLDMSIEDLFEVDVVTVTNTKVSRKDAPATLFVYTEEDIRQRGYQNILDLLTDVPGIEIQRNAGQHIGTFVSVRGVLGNERLMILQDGYRVNSPTGLPVNINTQFSLKDAKRVEVILGPASALYGADAFSGVVNIITKKGGEIDGVIADSSYGDFGTWEHSAVYGQDFGEVELTLAAHWYESDEPNYTKYYPDKFSWYTNEYATNGNVILSPFEPDVVLQTDIRPYETPSDSRYLHAKLNIGEFEAGVAVFEEAHNTSIGSKPEFGIYTAKSANEHRIISTYLQHTYTTDDDFLSLRSSLWRGGVEILPNSAFVDLFTGFQPGYKYSKEDATRLQEQLTLNVSEDTTVVAGAMYEVIKALPWTSDLPFPYDRSLSSENQRIHYIGTDVFDAFGNDKRIFQDFHYVSYENASFYGQVQQKLFDDLMDFTGGARIDNSSVWGTNVSPRAALVIKPSDPLRVKLLYGQSFLAPSPFNAYSHYGAFLPQNNQDGTVSFTAPFWHLPAPDLEPEELTTYEANIQYFLGEGAVFSVNAFFTEIDNAISQGRGENVVFQGIPVDFAEILQNNAKQETYGVTAGLDSRTPLFDEMVNLDTYLYYTYLDGDQDGLTLPYFAKNQVKAGVVLNYDKLYFATMAQYRSRTYSFLYQRSEDLAFTSSGYTNVNLNVEYRDLIPSETVKSSLFLRIDNLFDKRYYNAPVESEEFMPAVPQIPQKIVGGVRLQF